ncbi:MAG: double zinc ribbon domain-containing protein [Candidatus Helarchaeota archaeon]
MWRIRKYCEVCKKEFLTDFKYCPMCNNEFKRTRMYCKNCERDIIVEESICPQCGGKTFFFKKIKTRAKCKDCLEEFCINDIESCPLCNSKNIEEIECPCVYYPKECVELFEN